jgi:hypothetical protein
VSITQKLLEKIVGAVESTGERLDNRIRAGFAQTEKGLRLTGARNRPVYPNSLVWGGPGRLMGWNLRATGTDPAGVTVTVHDGRDTAGEQLLTVDLAAGDVATVWLGPSGVSVTEALFLAADGPVAGSVYLGAVD